MSSKVDYGEIGSDWTMDGQQYHELCIIVFGDDIVETRRMVHAFGRGCRADDLANDAGQEALRSTTYKKGWPGKVSRFVLWEFQEWPTSTGDEEADKAAQNSFAHVSDRAHAGVVIACSPEGAQTGYLKIRPAVLEETPIMLIVGGNAAQASYTLKWVDAQGIPRGTRSLANRATANGTANGTAGGKQRRRSSGSLRRSKSAYKYTFACTDGDSESAMATVASGLLADIDAKVQCALM